MSSLSSLAASMERRPPSGISFSERFPAKVIQLEQSMHYNIDRAVSTNHSARKAVEDIVGPGLSGALENDIRSSGDSFEGRNSSASCLMTRWDMHKSYDSFETLGKLAIEAAQDIPLAKRTDSAGQGNPVVLYVQETWGLIYTKGHTCKAHTHWPSIWSYTYCVRGCEDCAPLVFPTIERSGHQLADSSHKIPPVQGQLVLFPSWVNHYVPEQTCEHERIMISGNLDVRWPDERDELFPEAAAVDEYITQEKKVGVKRTSPIFRQKT